MNRLATIASCFCLFSILGCRPPAPQWVLLNVNRTGLQADAHLLQLPGAVILIDAGDPNKELDSLLKGEGVHQIDMVLITHSHKDHYGGLETLLASGFPIKKVVWNLPSESVCKAEEPWGCDWNHVQSVRRACTARGIALASASKDEVLGHGTSWSLKVLVAYNGENSPIGRTDINDTSVITQLQFGSGRILFTGDLNSRLGRFLSENPQAIRSHVLKVTHHGTEATAPDVFFDAVQAKLAFVPSPEPLWNLDRSKRIRSYFMNREIPTYVSGALGTVRLWLNEAGFAVESTKTARKPNSGFEPW